jgi:hypothetical protein
MRVKGFWLRLVVVSRLNENFYDTIFLKDK